jgi:hypothetical protein
MTPEINFPRARYERKLGYSYVWIAHTLGVDPATVRRAVIGLTWKHI